MEAKRLLGEADEAEAQTLDVNLTEMRDQQDKLDAAVEALKLQQSKLDSHIREHTNLAGAALTKLAGAVEAELEEELKLAVAQISSIAHRLYAFYTASNVDVGYNRKLFEMNIPAINGNNLFVEPVHFHPRHHGITRSNWQQTPEAVKIYDQMKVMGETYQRLKNLDRAQDKTSRRKKEEAA